MRNFIDLVESNQSANYYHVTFTSRLPKIKQEGLLPGRRRNWSAQMGGKLGDTKLLYVMSDFSAAVRWAHRMEWEFKKPCSILMLRDVGGNIRPDEHWESMGKWFTTDEKIPSTNIVRVIPMSLELTRALVKHGTVEVPSE